MFILRYTYRNKEINEILVPSNTSKIKKQDYESVKLNQLNLILNLHNIHAQHLMTEFRTLGTQPSSPLSNNQ